MLYLLTTVVRSSLISSVCRPVGRPTSNLRPRQLQVLSVGATSLMRHHLTSAVIRLPFIRRPFAGTCFSCWNPVRGTVIRYFCSSVATQTYFNNVQILWIVCARSKLTSETNNTLREIATLPANDFYSFAYLSFVLPLCVIDVASFVPASISMLAVFPAEGSYCVALVSTDETHAASLACVPQSATAEEFGVALEWKSL